MSAKRWFGLAGIVAAAGIMFLGLSGMGAFSQSPAEGQAQAAPILAPEGSAPASFVELLKASQRDKKGLTFHVGGQTIGGLVVKAPGDGTVEVRNQEFGRIVIRLDRVDAVAIH